MNKLRVGDILCVFLKGSEIMKLSDYQLFLGCIGDLLASDSVQAMNGVTQHIDSVNCFAHCLFVAYVAYRVCRKLRLSSREAARGGLLHDMFLYDQHDPHNRTLHLIRHPEKALENADRCFALSPVERDAIRNHMWPLGISHIPHSKEAAVVCMADKFCTIAEITGLYKAFGVNKISTDTKELSVG